MRTLTVAFGLIEQGDQYLLQLRGDNPMIGGAGLIGCFGGKVESGEAPKTTARREINEETTLNLIEQNLKDLGSVRVTSDHRMETVRVTAYVYRIKIPSSTIIEAREGKLVRINKRDATEYLNKMTTGTRAAFKKFIPEAK
jgi:ADP-ribose pyrophosphatase YjhB (NUDIX family)